MITGRTVTIVGGGLGGLALGLRLQSLAVPCVLWEAHSYPRHRVCGEFLSGRGVQVLEALGLRDAVDRCGARSGRSVAFFTEHRCAMRAEFPEAALCLSRHSLDALLAGEFVRRGGQLHTSRRFGGDLAGAGVVRASGRRPTAAQEGWRWVGLKAHAWRAASSADLEMHFLPHAYVGVCAIEDGRFNVCGLFRSREPLRDAAAQWARRLSGPENSPLREVMKNAEFDRDSFTAVAGLSLRRTRAALQPECCIGDSLGMIPPLTGNGMSIALESAMLASGPLAVWSRGGMTWPEAKQAVSGACDAAFESRLRWAAWVQHAVMERPWRSLLATALALAPWLSRLLYRATR